MSKKGSSSASCVYDSQGAFACPGAAAYVASRDAQTRQFKHDNAWVDGWVPVENRSDMRYATEIAAQQPSPQQQPTAPRFHG